MCGYYAVPQKNITPEGYTHEWTAFVKQEDGRDIQHVVEKVVFQLHKDYEPNQKRGNVIIVRLHFLLFSFCITNTYYQRKSYLRKKTKI